MSRTEMLPRMMLLIAGEAENAGELLKRIPVAMVARGVKGKQKFSVTLNDLLWMVKNFRIRKRRGADLVIDYDHSTEYAGHGEASPAAGWLKEIDDAPDANGVLWGMAQFTERAAKMLAAREYKYFSPVITWGERDKVTGEPQGTTLRSIALTNMPFIEALPAFAFSDGWTQEIDRGDAAVKERKRMVKVIMADRVARTVRVVDEDGAEQLVPLEGLPRVLTMSDVRRGAEGLYDFASLDTWGDVVIAGEVFRGVMVQAELSAAVKAGKITPAQWPHFEKLALSDIEGFRSLVKTMRPQITFGELGIGGTGDDRPELERINAMLDFKAKEKMKAQPSLGYSDALKIACNDAPDMVQRRERLQRRGDTQ